MINFPCKCGHPFSLADEQAGGLIQCPACGLLVDIPTLSDLRNLNPDGTFAFDESAGLGREHFAAITLQEQSKLRPVPRYDPVTGELIRPLPVKDEKPTPVLSIGELVDPSQIKPEDLHEPLPVVAIPAPPPAAAGNPHSLGYALGDARKQVTLGNMGLELFLPGNMAVMFFAFMMYVLGYYTSGAIASYAAEISVPAWPFLIVNVPMWLVLAHMGCVIETTGPNAIEELPRPLGDLSLGEDFFSPLFRTLLAGILCFWPMVLAVWTLNRANPAAGLVVLMLGLAGAFFFPAVVLTTVTGTTFLNLRPDRVLAVMRLCGGNYPLSILLFVLAIVPSTYYIAGDMLHRIRLSGVFFQKIDSPPLMLGPMMIAVYLLHFFCWHLGIMYRQNHGQFPWLLQRHVQEKSNDEIRMTR